MTDRKKPMEGDGNIEMELLERQLDGGVKVEQDDSDWPQVHEHSKESRWGGLVTTEEDVDIHEL
jgi:hypothetical protein